jgi:hypothetical protein
MSKGKPVYFSNEVTDLTGETPQTKVVEQYGKMPDPDYFYFDDNFPLHTGGVGCKKYHFSQL